MAGRIKRMERSCRSHNKNNGLMYRGFAPSVYTREDIKSKKSFAEVLASMLRLNREK